MVVLRQVVSGMLYLHSQRIMHRDLTLSNLLLASDGSLRIADFGLATQLKKPDDRHTTMCGTPNYMRYVVVYSFILRFESGTSMQKRLVYWPRSP